MTKLLAKIDSMSTMGMYSSGPAGDSAASRLPGATQVFAWSSTHRTTHAHAPTYTMPACKRAYLCCKRVFNKSLTRGAARKVPNSLQLLTVCVPCPMHLTGHAYKASGEPETRWRQACRHEVARGRGGLRAALQTRV